MTYKWPPHTSQMQDSEFWIYILIILSEKKKPQLIELDWTILLAACTKGNEVVHLQNAILCHLISCVTSEALLYSLPLIRRQVMFMLGWHKPAEGAPVNLSHSQE